MKNARLVAFETLYRIFYDNAYSNIALDNALSGINKDKAFISALVYGVVERKITLDYFIDKYTNSRPKPKILTILRLGAYQLLFMDKVPASAAINESVELTRLIKQDYYSKLINAVLHKIADDLVIPDDLSVRYSVPQGLINMWTKQYGADAVMDILSAVNERPPVFAVPNRKYVDEQELLYELLCENVECEIKDDVVLINSAIDLKKSRAFSNGLFYIEDLSCYNAVKELGATEGELIYDMCSAPGGKAFTMAQQMNSRGEIRCFDVHASRVGLIDSSASRLGLDIIKTAVNDAGEYNASLRKADRILCDVPCSGYGIIRRKPEIRYKDLDSVKELPQLQLKILETSSHYLKPDGYIMYSTCTLNKKENEKVVRAFLDRNSGFRLIKQNTIFPSADGGDGFYYALLHNEN